MLYGGKLLCCDFWYHDMLYGGILKLRDVVMVTCLPWNMLYKGRLLNCDHVDTVMAGIIAFRFQQASSTSRQQLQVLGAHVHVIINR